MKSLVLLAQVKGVRRMQLMFGRIISADFILPPKVSSYTRLTMLLPCCWLVLLL